MKVLLLVHGLEVGGAESMLAALARHLRAAGDTVEIGCLGVLGTIGEELRAENVPVVVHERRPGFDATLPGRLARRIRSGRFDVVHAHQRTALFYGLLAGLLHGTPIVYSEHGPHFGVVRARQRLFNRLLGRRLRAVTAVSRHTARGLAADEGFGGRDVAVVPNGIDVERWAAAARRGGDAVRRQCGLPIGAPILGSVGRLHPVKNQQLLVRALAILRRRIADAALVLIGEGPQRDELAALAHRLGVGDAVHFLGERRDVEQLLPAVDVFCLSSLSEGIPLTLLEAMAARVPVIAVAAGGVAEAVASEADALLIDGAVAHGEPVAERLAAAAQRLLGDAALRQRLTERAAVRVQAEFTIEAACRRYRALLQAACA